MQGVVDLGYSRKRAVAPKSPARTGCKCKERWASVLVKRWLGSENRLAYESYLSRLCLVPLGGRVLEPYRAQERKRL